MKRSSLMFAVFAAAMAIGACQSVNPPQEPGSATQNTMNTNDFTLPEIPPAKLFQHPTPEIFELDVL